MTVLSNPFPFMLPPAVFSNNKTLHELLAYAAQVAELAGIWLSSAGDELIIKNAIDGEMHIVNLPKGFRHNVIIDHADIAHGADMIDWLGKILSQLGLVIGFNQINIGHLIIEADAEGNSLTIPLLINLHPDMQMWVDALRPHLETMGVIVSNPVQDHNDHYFLLGFSSLQEPDNHVIVKTGLPRKILRLFNPKDLVLEDDILHNQRLIAVLQSLLDMEVPVEHKNQTLAFHNTHGDAHTFNLTI